VLLVASLDRTARRSADIERALGLHVAGSIPWMQRVNKRNGRFENVSLQAPSAGSHV
jgi:hypothetical protein